MGPTVPWAAGHLGTPNIHMTWWGQAQQRLPGPLPRGGVAPNAWDRAARHCGQSA